VKKLVILALIALIFVLPFSACGGGKNGIKTDGVLSYTLINAGTEYSVGAGADFGNTEVITIPAEYNGLLVTAIAAGGFSNKTSLKAVIFENGSNIKNINDTAFLDCVNLAGIILPESLISLGNNVFQGCINLTEIEFKRAVNAAGDGLTPGNETVFAGCSALTYIFVPDVASVTGYSVKAVWNSPADIKTRIITRAENTYIITFDLNGGNIGGNTSTIVKMTPPDGGEIIWPELPLKSGITFKGWYIEDLGNIGIDAWTSLSFKSDTVIIAVW